MIDRAGAGILMLTALAAAQAVSVPKTWDEEALHDWATPVAGLGVRPGHFSAKEYYASPVDNYRTYPVYAPGREPAGYWEKIRGLKPAPLIDASGLHSRADWIAAGRRVWEEWDLGAFRRYDPGLIEKFRAGKAGRLNSLKPRADGTVPGVRYVMTDKGLALTAENCTGCHRRYREDGSVFDGPGMADLAAFAGVGAVSPLVAGMSAVDLPGDDDAKGMWRSFAVPWVKDDVHEKLLHMAPGDLRSAFLASIGPNLSPRWSGSVYYPTKIPDLIALKGQKYIDHTGTHKYRGTADLMRYAALVSFADSSDFGPHRMLTDEQRKVPFHLPDEGLYALALFVESLEFPANPNRGDARAERGKQVFAKTGCGGCHSGPNYTSGKLTLAEGFTPPAEVLKEYDVLPVSVKTDAGLALKTRKGTGFYKVPSLRGVWYRGRYLHDGAVTSLEEMFDPKRLEPGFVPSGFRGMDKTRAVKGHEFGLSLPAADREALVAFLKTL